MTETKYYQQDTELWHKLIDQEKAYLETRKNFLNSSSRVELIKKALQNPSERATALKVSNYIKLITVIASEAKQSSAIVIASFRFAPFAMTLCN